ncbi:DUF3817 domain-containing protein [Kocuria rhizophila]|nr:DUF3817 domain-containing protein [Kocuria rhizophila]
MNISTWDPDRPRLVCTLIYLLSCLRVWSLMRWPLAARRVMALGGVVPFLSFIVERKIHRSSRGRARGQPQGRQALLRAPPGEARACSRLRA